MREIKFRAWDKESRHGGGMRYSDDYPDYGCFFTLAHGQCTDPRTNPLMQFTGLHDKNGKEIYEGDIVRDCSHGDGQFAVTWNDDLTGYYAPIEWCEDEYIHLGLMEVEVIGNIYENPDLLTNPKQA